MISTIPVEPGLTNEKTGERVVGFNSENVEINEGMVRFDIVFYVRMKDGLAQIIVNIEAQKDEPTEYHILNRAIFYAGRKIRAASSTVCAVITKTYHEREVKYY